MSKASWEDSKELKRDHHDFRLYCDFRLYHDFSSKFLFMTTW